MGFFKRLLSLGGKKNKQDRPQIVHNVPVPELPWAVNDDGPAISNEEEHEAAIGRLLRSSSARFAESTELDYANLPPLPHPINHVIQPASSSLSIASTTLTRQGTYNVTVHKRRRHGSTEVPPMPNTPATATHDAKPASKKRKSLLMADDSRTLRLRSDPSVVSLISLYDDHGKLSADAFNNDTPREKATKSAPTTMRSQLKTEPLRDDGEGRAQVKRSGSTLRQLLGASVNLDNNNNADNSGSGEGDISWAERFLAETESTSTHSSVGLVETPITPHSTHFYTQALKGSYSFISEADASTTTIDNPAISSMEVELSATSLTLGDIDDSVLNHSYSGHSNSNSNTPVRGSNSHVLDFLTKRGKRSGSTTVENMEKMERTLPELPSCFSSPSDEDHANAHAYDNDVPQFHFDDETPASTVGRAATRSATTTAALRVDIPSLPDNTPRPVRHRHNALVFTPTRRRAESHDPRTVLAVEDEDDHFFTPRVHRHQHQHSHDTHQHRNDTHQHRNDTHHNANANAYREDRASAEYDEQERDERERNADADENADEVGKMPNDIKVMLNGPTKVIVTAPTPGYNPSGPARLPRGPRALPKRPSFSTASTKSGASTGTAGLDRRRSALLERSSSNASLSMSRANPVGAHHTGSSSGGGSLRLLTKGSTPATASVSISDPFSLGHPRRRANTSQRIRSPSSSSLNSFTRSLRGEDAPANTRADDNNANANAKYAEGKRGERQRERERERERARAREEEKENHGRTRQRSRSPLALGIASGLGLSRGVGSHLGLGVKTDLPATPMRVGASGNGNGKGSRALLKSVVQQAMMFHPPLPPTHTRRYEDVASDNGRDKDTDRERENRKGKARDMAHRGDYEHNDRERDYDHHGGVHAYLHGQGQGHGQTHRTPSPASSTEMSPVGRQIMMDVRQQRLDARLAERERASNRRGGSERRGYGL